MNKNIAPALYIHIPFCQSKCRYCAFYSEPLKSQNIDLFISALIKELSRYDFPGPFNTIYIGGGSPSVLPRKNLFYLIEQVLSRWGVKEEFTIETNPSQVDEFFLKSLYDLGVNRISIGAQTFNPALLKFLGRAHNEHDIINAVKLTRKAGFENVSLDLIFALPRSTLQTWQADLQSAIDLDIEHISAYSLTYEENTPLKSDLDSGIITAIDEQTDRTMYELAIDMLADANINQYEISNFARNRFQCRHNLTYWSNHPYIGIGPAAGSYWKDTRTLNVANTNKYIKAINQGKDAYEYQQLSTGIDLACETAVLNLRRIVGINLTEFKLTTGYDAMTLFKDTIEKNRRLGFLQVEKDSISLTRQALPIADSILCDFSAI